MRLLLSLALLAPLTGCAAAGDLAPPDEARPKAAAIDFTSQVRPILEARCSPCHFEGGQMYDRLPFDRPETLRQLGTRLFTRIEDGVDRAAIGAFLAQPAAEPPSSGSHE